VRRVRGSVYCTASFSVFSRRRAKLSIIYPDIRLDYKLATLPRVTPKAETVQQFMINPELQDAARGGVLRIDEASFLSARAGRWLLEFARDSGTRLVVPGDVRQHHSVERGDWLRVMEQTGAICYAAITKIFRQQIAPLRYAVRDLSQGKIEEGLDQLEKFGAICQFEDKTERLAKIAELQLSILAVCR
jgi:ATP-dependent exoDNAse (exonuclease V) alpha subunit